MARQGYDLDTIIRKAKTISDVAKVKEADDSEKYGLDKDPAWSNYANPPRKIGQEYTDEDWKGTLDRLGFDIWLQTGRVPGQMKKRY